jgi:hypothetical protein
MDARACANCGLSVALGYPRCPRCQAPLAAAAPTAPASLAARAKRLSGPPSGTSVEPSSPSRQLIIGAAAGAVALALVAWVALRSGPTKAASPPATAGSASVEEPTPPAAAALVVAEPPRQAAEEVNQGAAIDQLRREFGKARLYSQISVEGEQLELRSNSCGDSQLVGLLEQARSLLTHSGLRHIRCLQPHGQVVFSRDL